MLVALIPNVAEGLDTSVGDVAAAITAYMVPFALLQLFSGTIAERLGPQPIVRGGYIAFGLAALACAFAPDIWSFLAARAAMGAANAFLSPILLAALSEVAAPERPRQGGRDVRGGADRRPDARADPRRTAR